jgi:DNA polymerase-1
VIEPQNYIYVDDPRQAQEAVDYLSGFSRLGYDVETTGLKVVGNVDKLLLMQLGTEEVAYLFDPRKIDGMILKDILEDPAIIKIGHNLKFDYQATRCELGIQLDGMFDNQLAYRLLTSGLVEDGHGGYVPIGMVNKNKKQFPYKSFAFLARKFLGINMDKSVRTSFINHQYNKEFTPQQLRYAADDVLLLHPLCDILSDMLCSEGLIDTALLEFEFLRPVSEMEIHGVFIDQDHWRKIIQDAWGQAEIVGKEITAILEPFQEQNTLFGASTVNISSKDQIMDAFSKLGYNLENTEEKTLKSIDHDLAKLLLQWRGYDKLVSTYGEAVLKKISRVDNRLHGTFHQLGTHTGRLSAENPNLQNMPQDREDQAIKISFRECFQAEPGNKILTADYSQCELRILAEVSQDKRFIEIFEGGGDLHIITAQQVFGFTDSDLSIYNKVKKRDHPDVNLLDEFSESDVSMYHKVYDFRSKTKVINFGIAYGLSAWSLAERFKIPQNEAEGILDDYFSTYSGIKRWLGHNGHESIALRYSKTIIGRKRYYTLADPEDEQLFRRSRNATRRAGNNAVIQGTNADITKEALNQLQRAYDNIEGAKLLFTVHDEIVSEVPEQKAEEISEIKAEIMRQAFHRFVKTVPVGKDDAVSVTIADHWNK